jgi:phage terminase large subunit GpA-like protein
MKPPPPLTVSQWAATNLILSPEYSAEPGPYRPERVPFQAGMMDALTENSEVVFMTSAQVGKTLTVQAVTGFFIDQDPAPILLVQPTVEAAEGFSKERLALMIRDSKCLSAKVREAKGRAGGNTILQKKFPGGSLSLVGANAPTGLSSRPIRVVLFDEVDRYPASAGTEGDPITLGTARTKTFWNRVVLKASTPGDEETSRIYPAFLESDQRHFHVRCPHCNFEQVLRWAQVQWAEKPEVEESAASARYACANETCAVLWDDGDRMDAVQNGRWIAKYPGRNAAGFHLNELYSPFRRLSEIVTDWLKAQGNQEKLKSFINTSLGEVWKNTQGEKVDPTSLDLRREPYATRDKDTNVETLRTPKGVLFVQLVVDVQDDRLECEFQGWGLDEETWGMRYKVLRGDPGAPELWKRLEDEMVEKFRREDGAVLHVSAVGIDSGGHYTKQVYDFCDKHLGRAHAMKGVPGYGKPLVRTSKRPLKEHRCKLHLMGADTAKEMVLLSRLKITKPGPRFMHVPQSYPDDYFAQLTAETRRTVYSRGHAAFVWTKKKDDRNEALDLRTMGLALVTLMAPNFVALAARIKPDAEPRKIGGLKPVTVKPRGV